MVVPEDLEVELGRGLSEEERRRVEVLVEDALTLIRARIPKLDEKMDDDSSFAGLVGLVVKSAVARVLRNPLGYRQESEDGYSYSLDTRAASGFLTILDSEWKLLLRRSQAFTISPRQSVVASPTPDYWDREGTPGWWGWFV